MNRRNIIFLLCAVFSGQATAQVLVDNFDPRVPRPGATLPASIDPYGMSRPLPPSIDPLGISYRPAHAGAVLPALYDPLGASRPGGLPFALDPVGYTRTGPYAGGYGGNYGGGFGGYGGYGGSYDSFLARPSGFITGVGGNPIFPDPNAAVPLLAARVPGTPLPTPTVAMPVMPVPVAPVAQVAPVSYPVNPVPVPVSVPVPTPAVNSFPVATPTFNAAPAFPTASSLPFGNGGVTPSLPLGGPNFSGSGAFPFGNGGVPPTLPNLPMPTNLPATTGTLATRPLSTGTTITGGSSSSVSPSGNFLPPV